jgi:deoxyribonuclease V
MRWRKLHPWRVPYAEAVAIQEKLRNRLVLKTPPATIRWVAGADVGYARLSQRLVATVLVFSYPELELFESRSSRRKAAYPYLPGLLTFREAPVLLQTFEKVRCRPDLVVLDGQGIAHPRGIGLASHIGILLDLPTIGCAKRRLVGTHRPVGDKRGSCSLLRMDTTVIGAALRTREKGRGYRLPEPTRQAHLAVSRLRRAGP